jgi:hypothetical protein
MGIEKSIIIGISHPNGKRCRLSRQTRRFTSVFGRFCRVFPQEVLHEAG